MVSWSRRCVGCWHDGGADQHVAGGASTAQSQMVSYCVVCNSTRLLLGVATDVGWNRQRARQRPTGLCLTAITHWLKTESSLWHTVNVIVILQILQSAHVARKWSGCMEYLLIQTWSVFHTCWGQEEGSSQWQGQSLSGQMQWRPKIINHI